MSGAGHRTALPFPSSLRASVERGDPLSIYRTVHQPIHEGVQRMFAPVIARDRNGSPYLTTRAALADEAEAHASQAVTAHPQTSNPQTNGDDADVMTHWDDLYAPHGVRYGVRCPSKYSGVRCMNLAGHSGRHRWTSGADGRSLDWLDPQPDGERPAARWVQCQRCFYIWDDEEPEHRVCPCLDKYGTRTVASLDPKYVQSLVNEGNHP